MYRENTSSNYSSNITQERISKNSFFQACWLVLLKRSEWRAPGCGRLAEKSTFFLTAKRNQERVLRRTQVTQRLLFALVLIGFRHRLQYQEKLFHSFLCSKWATYFICTRTRAHTHAHTHTYIYKLLGRFGSCNG